MKSTKPSNPLTSRLGGNVKGICLSCFAVVAAGCGNRPSVVRAEPNRKPPDLQAILRERLKTVESPAEGELVRLPDGRVSVSIFDRATKRRRNLGFFEEQRK